MSLWPRPLREVSENLVFSDPNSDIESPRRCGRIGFLLAGEPRFNILDAGLERGHLLLQLGQVARENLAPPALVAKARLDPAQPLGDRLILLLEALEPAVDLVEVAEHLAPQFGNLPVDLVESPVDLVETAGNVIELAVDLLEALVELLEALVDLLKALVDFIEAAVDLSELPTEELDQLFVLARRHGLMTIPGAGPTQAHPPVVRPRVERAA